MAKYKKAQPELVEQFIKHRQEIVKSNPSNNHQITT